MITSSMPYRFLASQTRSSGELIRGTGTPVTTSRFDVQYICTEYGVVNLFGKTVSERAEALIEIAHPDFRPALRRQAVEEGLIW